jgi:hypothetical protein
VIPFIVKPAALKAGAARANVIHPSFQVSGLHIGGALPRKMPPLIIPAFKMVAFPELSVVSVESPLVR